MALSKYKTKKRLAEMLKRLSDSCKEDNLEKFEYSISEVFKISLGLNFPLHNKGINSVIWEKMVIFVYENLTSYNPKSISEKYLEEFQKLYFEIKNFNKSEK